MDGYAPCAMQSSDAFPSPTVDRVPPAVPRPGNLPAELDRFVGRSAELAALARAMERSRLVTVTGVGGIGKTRCALRAAQDRQDRFCDGVWLVELSALRDPALLEDTVAGALGLARVQSGVPGAGHHARRAAAAAGHEPYPEAGALGGQGPPGRHARQRHRLLAERLADRELLLVLDGYERIVGECARLAAELLRRAPGVRVLAAGRRPLEIAGERVLPLAPLPVPGDAVQLFADRAAAVLPGFAVTPANRSAVAELCRRLDGLPLALELAAVRLRALSVEQLLDRLEDRFALLTGGDRSAPERHHALRTAIGWSHELCTPAERLLWARLSVFAGQFDLDAAEYLCAGDGLEAEDVLPTLESLVAQSVAIREDGPGGVRYRMIDTVREYGAGWLEAQGDGERLRRRHRDWYLGLATWCELDWFGPRQDEVAARIGSDLPNLRLALDYCLSRAEEAHIGQYLAATLWFYWVGCGRLNEGRHWLERAAEAESGNDETRTKTLWALGYVSVLQGDALAALAALHECQELAERSGNTAAAACALHHTGSLALLSDDLPRAEELLGAALERYREIGELNSHQLMGQVALALTMAFRGDVDGAVELCEEVRDVCRDHGERWTLAYALYVLAYAAWARGEPEGARDMLRECLAIDHCLHDLVGAALALELLALLTEDSGGGDAYEAAVLQGAAAGIWPAVGRRRFGSRLFDTPYALCEERVRTRLGPELYATALAEGSRLDMDTVVARALRGPQPTPPVAAPRARPGRSGTPRRPAVPPPRGGTGDRRPDQRA